MTRSHHRQGRYELVKSRQIARSGSIYPIGRENSMKCFHLSSSLLYMSYRFWSSQSHLATLPQHSITPKSNVWEAETGPKTHHVANREVEEEKEREKKL
jgi:hypothetical protein